MIWQIFARQSARVYIVTSQIYSVATYLVTGERAVNSQSLNVWTALYVVHTRDSVHYIHRRGFGREVPRRRGQLTINTLHAPDMFNPAPSPYSIFSISVYVHCGHVCLQIRISWRWQKTAFRNGTAIYLLSFLFWDKFLAQRWRG